MLACSEKLWSINSGIIKYYKSENWQKEERKEMKEGLACGSASSPPSPYQEAKEEGLSAEKSSPCLPAATPLDPCQAVGTFSLPSLTSAKIQKGYVIAPL